MIKHNDNPLGLVPDPFAGDIFVLPPTLCTEQRKGWFHRVNEIMAFQLITEYALRKCKESVPPLIPGETTPTRINSPDGRAVIMTKKGLEQRAGDGLEYLGRQVFVMLYGAFEMYLFELIERSFPEFGITEEIDKKSIEIMMGKKWDGKLCSLSDTFQLNYKVSDLIKSFKDFKLFFEEKQFTNPVLFLEELAPIRHRIVHGINTNKEGKPIYINFGILQPLRGYYFLMTDYIDELFNARFGFQRTMVDPAIA